MPLSDFPSHASMDWLKSPGPLVYAFQLTGLLGGGLFLNQVYYEWPV